jgi:predicted PurR-regulated permease PerM
MQLNLTIATRIGLNVLAFLAISMALWLGRDIFIPLTIAGLLAMILYPAAHWLHHKARFPWFMATSTMIGLLIITNLGVFIGIGSAVPRVLAELPNPSRPTEMNEFYGKLRNQIQSVWPGSIDEAFPIDPEESKILAYVKSLLKEDFLIGPLMALGKFSVGFLWSSVLVLFILLFLMLEGEMLARRVRKIFGNSQITQSHVTSAIAEIAMSVRAYLIWRTLVNIGLGIFLGIVYQSCGLRQPWTWALFTAVLCYVPYIGTIIAGIPPVLDAFVYVSPLMALGIGILYIIVVTVEGYYIVPVVMGRNMDLNATTVLLTCLFWDLIWGTPGLFLAMPLMAGVKAICMHVPGWEVWGSLMSAGEIMDTKENPLIPDALAPNDNTPPPSFENDGDATIRMEDPDATILMEDRDRNGSQTHSDRVEDR